jgi:hypothetical protein
MTIGEIIIGLILLVVAWKVAGFLFKLVIFTVAAIVQAVRGRKDKMDYEAGLRRVTAPTSSPIRRLDETHTDSTVLARRIYSPLEKPDFDVMPVPDVKVLRRDASVVNEMMKWVRAQIAKTTKGAPVPPDISAVQEGLLQAFARSRPEQRESLRPHVYLGCHVGYLMGVMENEGGAAKPGYSEGHYWTALVMLMSQLPVEQFVEEVCYSVHAAYYIARTGMTSLEPCVAEALLWASRQPTDP